MREIPVDYKVALVDDEDYDHLMAYKWHLHTNGYAKAYESGQVFYMHRAVRPPAPNLEVHHIDGNRLNNQKDNLICISASLHRHTMQRKTRVSRGVRISDNKFEARIQINGKRVSLGRFNTEQEAQDAYHKKAKELYDNPTAERI